MDNFWLTRPIWQVYSHLSSEQREWSTLSSSVLPHIPESWRSAADSRGGMWGMSAQALLCLVSPSLKDSDLPSVPFSSSPRSVPHGTKLLSSHLNAFTQFFLSFKLKFKAFPSWHLQPWYLWVIFLLIKPVAYCSKQEQCLWLTQGNHKNCWMNIRNQSW